jgi:hypothetical protein
VKAAAGFSTQGDDAVSTAPSLERETLDERRETLRFAAATADDLITERRKAQPLRIDRTTIA